MTNLGEVAKFLAVTTEVKGYIDFDKGVLKLDQKPQKQSPDIGSGSLSQPVPRGTYTAWCM